MNNETGWHHALDTKAVGTNGAFVGYASLFDVEDLGRDMVRPGAFTKSLVTRPASKVKMLRGHDPDDPIGVWTSISEDGRGLKVAGQLILDTARGRETHALLKAGALDGLSIGYRAKRQTFDRTKNVRLLEEIDLFEISVVTFPMLESATVGNVKHWDFASLAERINRAKHALTKDYDT